MYFVVFSPGRSIVVAASVLSSALAVPGGEEPGNSEIDIHVLGLDGEGLALAHSFTGHELHMMASEGLPPKFGTRVALQSAFGKLDPTKTLKEQGLVGESACLTYVYIAISLQDACRFLLEGCQTNEQDSLEESHTWKEFIFPFTLDSFLTLCRSSLWGIPSRRGFKP